MNYIFGFTEILELFGRRVEDVRWLGLAESMEYLSLVRYQVHRNEARVAECAPFMRPSA